MDKIVIEGGVPLSGEVEISGAKNAALPIIAATLLAPGEHRLYNVPPLADIRTIKRLLANMGVSFKEGEPEVCEGGHPGPSLRVDSGDLTGFEAPYELVKTMRAAVLVLGPLVARARKARVSLPGGCAIGARPINLHLKGDASPSIPAAPSPAWISAPIPTPALPRICRPSSWPSCPWPRAPRY